MNTISTQANSSVRREPTPPRRSQPSVWIDLNSIKFLNPGGLIIFHDCIPKNFLESAVPRISQTWTGDVWKASVQLSFSKNCKFSIANLDHGVAILKIQSGFELENIENIENMNFNDFENNFYNKLPLKTYVEILKEIDQIF